MSTLVSFLMAVLPAVLLVYYYYRQVKSKPKPKGLIINIFLLGVCSSLAVIILTGLVRQANVVFRWSVFFTIFFEAFIVAGLCEEYIKLLIIKNYAYHKPSFNGVMDGIIYTIVVSMGFACMENIIYVMNNSWHNAIARGFTAVPLHAVCSGMMGYYIGQAKFAKTKKEEKSLIYQGLWQAVAIHGLYNFLLMFSEATGAKLSVLIVPLILWTYLRLKNKIRLAGEHELTT